MYELNITQFLYRSRRKKVGTGRDDETHRGREYLFSKGGKKERERVSH
jgi:hypothetical protein